MKDIAKIMTEYLNMWKECVMCSYMIKTNDATNHRLIICKDCVENKETKYEV